MLYALTSNERSLTSIEETRYTDSLMERLVSSTLLTSDSVATATVLDGFTVAQSDYLGGSWSFTRNYKATGILSTQTDIAARPINQSDGEGKAFLQLGNNMIDHFFKARKIK